MMRATKLMAFKRQFGESPGSWRKAPGVTPRAEQYPFTAGTYCGIGGYGVKYSHAV